MRARERYLDAVGFARRLYKVGEERRASLLYQDLTSEAEPKPAPEPTPEPEPEPENHRAMTEADIDRFARLFANRIGSMERSGLYARREKWRGLFQ